MLTKKLIPFFESISSFACKCFKKDKTYII